MRIEIPAFTIRVHNSLPQGGSVDLTPVLDAIAVIAQKLDAHIAGASAEDQKALSYSLASIKALLAKADAADGKPVT